MRFRALLTIVLTSLSAFATTPGWAEEPSVTLATHTNTLKTDAQALERIRKIVLNQGEDSRALANLVQLTRDQPAAAAAQLYSDLADDYLKLGKYDQAANLLQQLLNQYADQPVAEASLVKLLRLYSSSEVSHTQTPRTTSNAKVKEGQYGFLRYAQHLAESTLQKHPALANDPALHFQRAVIARRSSGPQAAQGWLTKLKHNSQAGSWRTCAQTEKWLQENNFEEGREDKTKKPVVICHRTDQRPHLDGVLDDSLWQSSKTIQLAYDQEFLYLALRYPKVASQTYEVDTRPRTHDADLSNHDHVRLRLDLDRDYATCFELSVDHRGWTNDRCWYDASWNPQWFVAAGGDASTWTIEAAIAWRELTASAPRSGQAWAVAWNRILPISKSHSPSEETPATGKPFSLLLFE